MGQQAGEGGEGSVTPVTGEKRVLSHALARLISGAAGGGRSAADWLLWDTQRWASPDCRLKLRVWVRLARRSVR